MSEQQVGLYEVKQLAAQLTITFTGGEQEEWFDLETFPGALFALEGTYQNSAAGITTAYGDLVRYRSRTDQVEKAL